MVNNDAVVRTNFYKYFHPKVSNDAVVQTNFYKYLHPKVSNDTTVRTNYYDTNTSYQNPEFQASSILLDFLFS